MVQTAGTRSAGELIIVSVDGFKVSTQADAEGRFVLDGISAGLRTLVLRSANEACQVAVLIKPGRRTAIGKLMLTEAGTLSGRVTVEGKGDPIGGAMVALTRTTSGSSGVFTSRFATTDGNGDYTFEGVPQGRYLLGVSKNGHYPTYTDLFVYKDSVADGSLSMRPSAAGKGLVTGTVWLTIDGGAPTPLAGVHISISRSDISPPPPPSVPAGSGSSSSGDPQWFDVFTGPDGKFRLEGVPAGEYIGVVVSGSLEGNKTFEVRNGATTSVDFSVQIETVPACAIEGRVVDKETGEPIADILVDSSATVELHLLAITRNASAGNPPGDLLITEDEYVLVDFTDSQGRYRLVVPMQTAQVQAHDVIGQVYDHQAKPVSPVPNGLITLDFELDKLEQFTLSGRVLMPSGEPVPGATVYYWRQSIPTYGIGLTPYTDTDENGNYSVSLAEGVWSIQASKDLHQSEVVEVDLREDTMQDLVLDR